MHVHVLRSTTLLAGGLGLAGAAAALAPSSALFPGPSGVLGHTLAVATLAAAFAFGFALPLPGLFALVVVTVLEGGFRKWALNNVAVFLVKDFLALGIYAAVLPRLRRDEWRRPWWLVVPLAAVLLLGLAYTARSEAWSSAAIGLRAYAIYVPLLWVAPRLVDERRKGLALVVLVLALAMFESALGAVQSLTGNEWLNRLVPGSLPALITVDGVSYLRPTGTLLQVGVFAAFVLFGFLAAFGLAVAYDRGRLLVAAAASLTVLAWGFVYASSRALTASLAIAVVATVVYLLARRRLLTIACLAGAAALGVVFLRYQPFLGGAVREGNDAFFLRSSEYRVFDESGKVQKVRIDIGTGNPAATTGFVARPFEPDNTGGAGTPSGTTTTRFRHQLDIVLDQRLLGHGTGTMTVGSEYALPGRKIPGESQYSKLAYELGLPGLAFYCWLLAAIAVAAALGAARTRGWQRAVAVTGLGTAVCFSAWMSLTFALDVPVVGLLFWIFTGCAVAYGLDARERPVAHRA